MYSHQIVYFPAIGKGPELRPILEERTRQRQEEGIRAALSSVAYGAEAPAFRANLQFDGLADLQAFREKIAGDTSMVARIAPLMRQTIQPELYEVLEAPPQLSYTVRFIQRVVIRPLPGKLAAVRELSLERVRLRNSEGIGAVLSAAMAGDGPLPLVLALLFDSLEGLEKLRIQNHTDKSFQAYQEKLAGLTVAGSGSIMEVLVPLQPR